MKIGYIDYYLDDWHANHFTSMFRERSDGRFYVAYAYGMAANPITGVTSKQWCDDHGAILCDTIQDVVEKSDVLFIAAPNNEELHPELARAALCSGKPTYIDKVMADSLAAASEMLELSRLHHTPCYSDSPLRHAVEYQALKNEHLISASFWGPKHNFEYGVHQLDPLLMLMKGSVKKVIVHTNNDWQHIVLQMEDGRNASYLCSGCEDTPYYTLVRMENETKVFTIESPFFDDFIDTILKFYESGQIPMDIQECLEVTAVIEAVEKAIRTPGCWVEVEKYTIFR